MKVTKKRACGGWHGSQCFKPKPCVLCGVLFKPASGAAKLCSTACKKAWILANGSSSTESQYTKISGSWSRYFCRLCQNSRRKYGTSYLTKAALLKMYRSQGGLCALSGVPLTCLLERGKRFDTNASVDRIDSSKQYIAGNVHLVCQALNYSKAQLHVDRFIWWCKQVSKHNG